jgi:hypothetical protein
MMVARTADQPLSAFGRFVMSESKSRPVELKCPTCQHTVTYDPDDPIHYNVGAMRRKPPSAGATVVVYLTCDEGHVRRYTVSA